MKQNDFASKLFDFVVKMNSLKQKPATAPATATVASPTTPLREGTPEEAV